MLKKALAIGLAAFAATAVTAAPASADLGTTDFFKCPVAPETVQSRADFKGLVLERCWSTRRNAWMYRANQKIVFNRDQLRTGYVPYHTKGWVANSYREAPANVDPETGEMPNEWVLSGQPRGQDLQACLTSGITGELFCTWP